ncbi:MAG: TonB-dependent receptor, partial [Acidobacteriota bacterium]
HVLLTRDRVDYASREDNERIRVANRGVYFWLSAVNQWTAALSSQSVASIGKLEWERQGVSEPDAEQIDVDDERNVTFYGLKQDWTWEPLRAHRFKAGADVRWLSSDYSYASSSTGSTGPEFESRQVFLEPQGTTVGLYVADRVRFGPALAVELGLRYDAQNYTDDHQLSPRVNAVWHASDRRTFRFGWGRFYQSQRIHELRVEDGETSFLPAQLSHQAVLTYDERLPGGLVLRVDAYVKKLSRVRPRYENLFNPIELFPETEPDRIRIAPDRGRAEGLELLLRSARGRPLVWWASYSLSSVDDELNGESIPRRWDQTHAVHFLIGYEINERWSVSVSGSAHSGWPTTPVAGELREQPDGSLTAERVLGQLNSDRFPDYFRLDAKLRGDFLRKSSTLGLEIEILNLLDRQNVCCVDEFGLEPQPDGTVTVFRTVDPWLGITPSLRLSWEF